VSAERIAPKTPNNGVFWSLRVLESALLLSALAGIGLFAWCLVDIVRIETAAAPTTELPPTAWPGIFLFFGSMVVLQVVRAVLQRYRRDDGTQRGDARTQAAVATAEVLASLPDESEPAAGAAEVHKEG